MIGCRATRQQALIGIMRGAGKESITSDWPAVRGVGPKGKRRGCGMAGSTIYTSKNGKGDTRLFESPKVPKVYFTRVNQPKSTSPKAVPRQYQRYCLGTALGLSYTANRCYNRTVHGCFYLVRLCRCETTDDQLRSSVVLRSTLWLSGLQLPDNEPSSIFGLGG